MSLSTLVILIILVFITSIIGVVTGSNSLITVPVMFQLGIDPKTAIATNMFGLTFMAIGGAIPFVRKGTVAVRPLSPFLVLTVIGSAIGAMIVGLITDQSIKIVVAAAMIAILVFTLVAGNKRAAAGDSEDAVNASARTYNSTFGYVIVFLLAIYGGLYSGGYVTVLTAALVAFFGMSYTHSIAATKVINIFSSGVATIVFIYQGLVDLKLGAILAVTMFTGAYIGANIATRMSEVWLRRIFLAAVLILVIKMIFDLAAAI